MVCARCVMAVESLLKKNGLHPISVELGHASVEEDISDQQRDELQYQLQAIGFDLLEDRQEQTIEKIKSSIIQLVQQSAGVETVNLSDYLADKLHASYSALSKLFSKVTGTTIEHYYIAQRIEKVKELLTYEELSLTQIAHRLGYSSVAYLSGQFKMVTGMTPSKFKSLHENMRKSLDEVDGGNL
jgi:AraC-like DNA-binding protein